VKDQQRNDLLPVGNDFVPDETTIRASCLKLVNLLGRGDHERKLAFLEENLLLMMLDVAATPGLEPGNRQPLLLKKVISWWRWREKHGGGLPKHKPIESFDERQRRELEEWLERQNGGG
jgi:hypothetical protein